MNKKIEDYIKFHNDRMEKTINTKYSSNSNISKQINISNEDKKKLKTLIHIYQTNPQLVLNNRHKVKQLIIEIKKRSEF